MEVIFKRNHIRAKKARFARVMLTKQTQFVVVTLAVASGIAGAYLVWQQGSDYAFALIPAVVLAMLQFWVRGDLAKLQPDIGSAPNSILLHEALDYQVLGKLHRSDSPKSIWRAVKGSWQQRFFAVRYGLVDEIFENNLSEDAQTADKIWQTAAMLARQKEQPSISAASVIVGIVMNLPAYENLLAQLHLEQNDLVEGIDWQRHIEITIERLKKKDHFGGFARDWAAGYTPILNQVGHNISNEIQLQGGVLHRQTDIHRRIEDQIINVFTQSGRSNVALVADVGAGKTTTVYSLAHRLLTDTTLPSTIHYHQIVSLNASTLIAHMRSREALEGAVLKLLSEAKSAKNVIVFLDDAHTFFNDGPGSVDLSNILMPVIENGAVRIITAFTPHEWQQLSAKNPALAGVMNQITLGQPTQQEIMQIIQDQIILIENKQQVTFMYQALRESYRLAERYVHDMAFPGKALKVLEGAASYTQNKLVTEQVIQESMETTTGTKIQTADVGEKQTLINLEDQIHQRMINQSRAVKVVSDALRRSRSGVGNPNKPVGTFMFLGPTGVGKTELAKSVAAVYFGGENKIIRVDMNQFVNQTDLARLVAPASQSATGLVAQITKQPFSVVLLDEIEKAHTDVINALLQVLDEGMLKDGAGRQVSFRDAIIIATSNAGADTIRQQIEAGRQLEEFEQQFFDQLISAGLFKPEFLNRFDEMVLFRPLKPEELLQIVDILVANVNQTLARQKVNVALTQAAKQWLVQNGYDPRMGARPLRRMVQRSVENIAAQKLLQEQVQPGSTLTLDVPDLEASVQAQ